ncbi:uncharacterized protein LOC144362662 [Saccoglossus kowalevskii]
MASILYVFISTLALFLGASAEIVDVFIDHKVTDWRTGIEFGPFHIHKETGIDSLGKQEFKNCGKYIVIPQGGRYHGNCTVFNEKSEEMMCVTADCTLN